MTKMKISTEMKWLLSLVTAVFLLSVSVTWTIVDSHKDDHANQGYIKDKAIDEKFDLLYNRLDRIENKLDAVLSD